MRSLGELTTFLRTSSRAILFGNTGALRMRRPFLYSLLENKKGPTVVVPDCQQSKGASG
jgi:hypothetical protein